MIKKLSSASLLATLFCSVAIAQQSLMRGSQIISPEIRSDNSVIFRLFAPNAKEARITGEWMPAQGFVRGLEPMVKGDSGVWSYTTSVLPSELYTYSFIVDGMRCNDLNNSFTLRDVASVVNYFIIDGEKGNYYKDNKVPHGTVSRGWYESPGKLKTILFKT